jgi:hypothetical protein
MPMQHEVQLESAFPIMRTGVLQREPRRHRARASQAPSDGWVLMMITGFYS